MAAVEGADSHLEQSPRKTLSRRGARLQAFSERDSPVDQTALDSLLARIAEKVSTARLHLKAFFQNYDKHNHSNVSKSQFCSVLEFCKILPESSSEVFVICFQARSLILLKD